MEDNIINFTSKNIENLPTPQLGKRFFYRDVKTNGLMLMVTPSGCKSFKVTRKKNGKLIRVTLGKYPDISIENARKAAAEVNYKISQGTNPNHEKNKIRNEITFGEMFNDYMEKYSKKHKKSWNEDKRNIERFCTKLIAKKASDISIKELQTLHIQIGDNNGEYQANRVLEKIEETIG